MCSVVHRERFSLTAPLPTHNVGCAFAVFQPSLLSAFRYAGDDQGCQAPASLLVDILPKDHCRFHRLQRIPGYVSPAFRTLKWLLVDSHLLIVHQAGITYLGRSTILVMLGKFPLRDATVNVDVVRVNLLFTRHTSAIALMHTQLPEMLK